MAPRFGAPLAFARPKESSPITTDSPVGDAEIELSVVIPAYNAALTLGEQLDALAAQQWSGTWEIVVADNGSTDSTRQLLEERASDRLRWVDASGRRGAAHARNVGAAHARGQMLLFCDADDVVGVGWVEAMGETLRHRPAATGPQEHERLNPPWLHGVYGTASARGMQSFEGIFPFGPTANLGLSREVFDALGGFDEGITVYEDLDLCRRLWMAGLDLAFVPDAIVHYRYRHRPRELFRHARHYGAAHPAVARELAQHDKPTPSRWRGLRRWGWLLRHLPIVGSRAERARWLVVAGGCVGRVLGSVRARYVLL